MQQTMIVIDGFYSEPDAVRRLALADEYDSGEQYNYPGYQSTRAYAAEALVKAFENLVGGPISVDPGTYAFGSFRVSTEKTGATPKIHHDGSTDWSGIVYLTPGAPIRSGTGIYRHKATGLEHPPTAEQAKEAGYDDVRSYELATTIADAAAFDRWDEVMYAEAKYNRLVLFRGSEFYHSPLHGYGSGVADGRLTQTFFFDDSKKHG